MLTATKVLIGFLLLIIIFLGIFFYIVVGREILEEREYYSYPKTIPLNLSEEEMRKMIDIVKKNELAETLYYANRDLKQWRDIAKNIYFTEEYEKEMKYFKQDKKDWTPEMQPIQNLSEEEAKKRVEEIYRPEEFESKRFKELPDRIYVVGAGIFFFKKDIDGKWKIEVKTSAGEGSVQPIVKRVIKELKAKDAQMK